MDVINLSGEETLPVRHKVLWPNESPEFCRVTGDDDAFHFGIMIDENIVCVASIYIDANRARLRKFATLPSFQGHGVGSFMLEHVITTLQKQGITYLWFDARESAIGFYRRFGFSTNGERFYKKEVSYFKMHAYL